LEIGDWRLEICDWEIGGRVASDQWKRKRKRKRKVGERGGRMLNYK